MARVEAIVDTVSKRKVPLPYKRDLLPELVKKLFMIITGEMDNHEIEIYADETDFFQKITGISGTLKAKEQSKAEKKAIIQKYLEKYQKELEERDPQKPPIYMIANPILKINKILTNSGLPMQSAERCPIMITFIVEYFEGPDKLKEMECCRKTFSGSKEERSPEEIKIELVDTERKDEKSPLSILKQQFNNLGINKSFIKKSEDGLHLLEVQNANRSAMIEPQSAPSKLLNKIKGLPLEKVLNRKVRKLFEGEKRFSCIFKAKDDVRQDTLSIQIIKIFQEIFRKSRLDLFLYPYCTISNRTGEVLCLVSIEK
jgi:phosphatidylinositol 4-kinase